MSVDALAEYLKDQLTHELATDAWVAQLKDANFEDEQVREELEPIIHDTNDFSTIFNDVGKLADKIAATDGGNTWKTLVDSKVDVDRVNGVFWVFIDKALAKNSNARDIACGFASTCCWLKLAGLKGSTLFHFFNQYLYKMVLSSIRLIYRLKMYGSRNATTIKKKKAPKGKKGAKSSAPMREEPEEEEEHPLHINSHEVEDMLEKACDALYSLLKTTPLSTCPEQAKESVDLVRDLIRLDICKDTDTTALHSQRDLQSRDRISDRAFGLAHLLCESRHSNGGVVVHTRLVMPRLLFFSWEGEVVPGTQSIPMGMVTARDMAISFLKNRIQSLGEEKDELETIAKLVSNIMTRCPERAEYRQKVSVSALQLLALLPKKIAQAQLQLVYTFGLTQKTGLRAFAVEMIPIILQTMDLDQDEEEEERNKSRREKKGSDEEEEEEEGEKREKKKERKGSDEEEDDEMNGTKRKIKKEKKKKADGSEEDEDDEMNGTRRKVKKEKKKKRDSDEEEEEEEMDRTRRKKKKGSNEEEEDEEEDGNTTKRKKDKKKKNKKGDEDEEEEEDEGNTTKRRNRTAKDQSMMRMQKQKKRNEEGSGEEEEESEGEKEKKKKKKQADKAKQKKAERSAPVELRPSLLMLMVRGCLDKAGNLRARCLQQLSLMINEDMGDEVREAADNMVRDCPNIFVQAMTSVDEEKEGEEEEEDEEEDEEKKARAAKLAELAAAELQIKNGLLYVVKSRMEDDVAAVRKAAVAALQTVFFVWEMEDEEAEEMANALKLRCLDTSQTVRKQAMETLTLLLDQSLDKGHRSLLETIWLRAVLPLINDRENAVQALAAKLVEDTLIEPIMRSSTPVACWNMLKRVEEEVSNRRLLVRTLAFLSTKESKTLKATVVDTLNKKLATDPDHSNVIWMLLADLSTVFGDKIDPRTAVRTWYALPENETANTLSYVAKVVGEGAKKLKDQELDDVAKDIEEKLLGYRVHGPHIPTVYLALARLMDAVGELANGTQELERFGRKLLEEASRIIYDELDMFTETDEDKQQEVAKEDEIRVIRIVITIGEVIQLSPSLIDFAEKLLTGLKMIMSSELYLSDFWQQRKTMNSAVPSMVHSRVPSAMGYVDTQGSGQHSETVNMGSQPTVIPSQVHQEMKNQTLRKALFTPAVRRCALTTIGKFCLMDENTAKKCVFTFIKQLQFNPDHIIRNNIVIVLCDLCIRYTLLVDKYTPIIASCLKDRAILVRQQTLECLTILIKEQFIRWEGQLMYRFVATILDECRPIREYAMFCLNDVLLPQDPSMFFNHFIECLLYFNDVPRKYTMGGEMDQLIDRAAKFTLSGQENENARIKLYEFMLATFDDKQKLLTMSKMCEEIFTSVYSGELNLDDEKVVALLTDAFKVISCEQMQFKLTLGKKGDDDDDDEPAPQAVQDAAKSAISDALRGIVITTIMPHILELRRYIQEKRHPIMKYMMAVLRALTRSHMDKLQEFFAGDKIALREIEYDIKRLNNLEEKLKLRAAEEAQMEAQRALLPPSRRQSTMPEGRNGMEEGGAANPDEGEMMEGMDGMEREGSLHPVARAETSTAHDDGESIDVEMDETAPVPVEKDKEDTEVEKEKEKEGEEEEAMDDGREMEVEEGQGEENGEEAGDGGEKENEQVDAAAAVEVVDAEVEEVGEGVEEGKKKTPAELGEAEIKEEPMEVEEDKENEKEREERRKRRKEEREKRKEKEMAEVVIKEEPVEDGEERENQFVAPSIIPGRKRGRAPSEVAWMNESAMVGGYGQSTPRKGTPSGDDESEEMGGPPRLDLDISAIAPPPAPLAKAKSRVSRKPKTGTIEE